MPDAEVVEWIREKYTAVVADLGERARRRWGAAEASSLGWGGIEAVAARQPPRRHRLGMGLGGVAADMDGQHPVAFCLSLPAADDRQSAWPVNQKPSDV